MSLVSTRFLVLDIQFFFYLKLMAVGKKRHWSYISIRARPPIFKNPTPPEHETPTSTPQENTMLQTSPPPRFQTPRIKLYTVEYCRILYRVTGRDQEDQFILYFKHNYLVLL